MSAATDNKKAIALLNQYIKLYTEKYGKAPDVNRFRDKWGFLDMITDLGEARAAEVIDYYFGLARPHPLLRLFRNYTDMSRIMYDRAEDAKKRERLRKETEERVKNWSPRVERN